MWWWNLIYHLSVQVSRAHHLCPLAPPSLCLTDAGCWDAAGCHGHRNGACSEESRRPGCPNRSPIPRRCPPRGLWGRRQCCSSLCHRWGTPRRPVCGVRHNLSVKPPDLLFIFTLPVLKPTRKLTLTSVRDSWMSSLKWSCWASLSGSSLSVWMPFISSAHTLSDKGVHF